MYNYNKNAMRLQSKLFCDILYVDILKVRYNEMASKENSTLRMEPELKAQAAALFKALGMDLSTATRMFYIQALRCQGLPFEVKLDEPNTVTRTALEEGDRMLSDPNAQRFSSVEDLFAELNS